MPPRPRAVRGVRRRLPVVLAVCLGVAAATEATLALGHGAGLPAPSVASLWTVVFDPVPWIGSIAALAGYAWLVRRVNRAHPRTPVPAWRVAAWVAGVLVIWFALASAIDAYADELLTVHMVQHLLLSMIGPPLLALGAPVTLALRASTPGVRHTWLLPILHSRAVRILAAPVVAWSLFTLVMWFAHFSPLYEAALENSTIHVLEHAAFVAAGLLFWWPVVGADPMPHRMGHGGRFVYLLAQMPVNAAVGLAIYFAPSVLYAHYAAAERSWDPSPLVDQQVGGLLMWTAGDLILLAAVSGVLAAWMQADGRRTRRMESRSG
jgi:putative membrane protein